MKLKIKKSILLVNVFVVSILISSTSNAHIHDGLMANLQTFQASQVQLLKVDCPAGSAKLIAQVADFEANKGIMSVTIIKDELVQTVSDLNHDDRNYGPNAVVAGGAGTYYMIASQTDKVFGEYAIQYHCEDAGGTETTGNAAVIIQQ